MPFSKADGEFPTTAGQVDFITIFGAQFAHNLAMFENAEYGNPFT
jgi:hypothetical protein